MIAELILIWVIYFIPATPVIPTFMGLTSTAWTALAAMGSLIGPIILLVLFLIERTDKIKAQKLNKILTEHAFHRPCVEKWLKAIDVMNDIDFYEDSYRGQIESDLQAVFKTINRLPKEMHEIVFPLMKEYSDIYRTKKIKREGLEFTFHCDHVEKELNKWLSDPEYTNLVPWNYPFEKEKMEKFKRQFEKSIAPIVFSIESNISKEDKDKCNEEMKECGKIIKDFNEKMSKMPVTKIPYEGI